ncbi:MAG: DNA-processing protein DprA [Patescibacteria group bacterium]
MENEKENEIRKLPPEEFPTAIREMADPPKELYLEGVLPNPKEYTYLTVVGSRRITRYGQEACEALVGGLAGYPIAIISGLAIGTDTMAHKAALDANLPTIGIPGSGLDRSVLHPSSNARLADQIVEAGGALLSELPPTAPAGIHTFPRRNRIMAGLSKATLIIEAGDKSGTLITARLALDYNREVGAVPGSIFSPQSYGTNRLIRQGATPITTSFDLLEMLGFKPTADANEIKTLDLNLLSPTEKIIIDLLSIEPLPRDELIRQLAQPTNETNVLLATMELKGLTKETLGEIRLSISLQK